MNERLVQAICPNCDSRVEIGWDYKENLYACCPVCKLAMPVDRLIKIWRANRDGTTAA